MIPSFLLLMLSPAATGVMSGPMAGYKGVIWGREPADFKQLTCANLVSVRLLADDISY